MNLTKQKAGGHHYLSSSFSPDGRFIVSARTPGAGPNGHADLVVLRSDGSSIRPITKTALWESSVDWGLAVRRFPDHETIVASGCSRERSTRAGRADRGARGAARGLRQLGQRQGRGEERG